jgi:hypothetical protein
MTVALWVGTQTHKHKHTHTHTKTHTQKHTHNVFPFEWMMVVNANRKMAPLKELYRVQEIAKSQMS